MLWITFRWSPRFFSVDTTFRLRLVFQTNNWIHLLSAFYLEKFIESKYAAGTRRPDLISAHGQFSGFHFSLQTQWRQWPDLGPHSIGPIFLMALFKRPTGQRRSSCSIRKFVKSYGNCRILRTWRQVLNHTESDAQHFHFEWRYVFGQRPHSGDIL